MKKHIYISLLLMIPASLVAQQFPFMEAYNLNPFSMSPSYAGIKNPQTLFIDYRSDWTGIESGPSTCQLSYNDRLMNKVGLGGKFIYDKTDIFKQTMLMGTYSYEVEFVKEHLINFGLSMGFYRNSVDLGKYYNDVNYVDDAALTYGQENSKIKLATDISALYRFRRIEAGVLLSNVMFGTVRYSESDITYKPMKNYLIHASYDFKINQSIAVRPIILVRGGQHYPAQLEIATEARYLEKIQGMLVYRTGGIWGLGFGGEVYKGVLLSYSYNLSANVATNTFGSHQVTLGIRLNTFIHNKAKDAEAVTEY
jgi:type IX secretion system PorP/SprF family membrane protein